MSDSSSSWFVKLHFFIRIRRFLHTKTTTKKCNKSLDQPEKTRKAIQQVVMESESEDGLVMLQRSVKQLHFGSCKEKEVAAKEIMSLAAKDLKTRKLLANLGVIPSLISMLEAESSEGRRLALEALIELANGTYTNKALMVEAEILSKLPANNNTIDKSSTSGFAQLLLSISSLVKTQFPISSKEILPFMIAALDSDSSVEAKLDCLGALCNLSTVLDNVSHMASNEGLVHILLRLSSEKEVAEKALATLGNLVVCAMGKKAIENDPVVPESLIEIMTWETNTKCQELSAYILMILAHQSVVQRAKMAKSGIVQVLLEVALLGSPLAQKRALKLLQWFKDERQTRIGAHSGPQTGRVVATGSRGNQNEIKDGKTIIKKMVRQSLNKNMEVIMRRASGGGGGGESSRIKGLVISSSSKSLPY